MTRHENVPTSVLKRMLKTAIQSVEVSATLHKDHLHQAKLWEAATATDIAWKLELEEELKNRENSITPKDSK